MRITSSKECVLCGKRIVAYHHNVKYCSECWITQRSQRQAAHYKKQRGTEKQKKEEFTGKSKNCNANIVAVETEARKLGLHYGDCMLMKRVKKEKSKTYA